jgi:hypothetical protein
MCFSPNILLEPVSVREQSRKFPEHLLGRKHCTLTLHVKAADFAPPFFYPHMLRCYERDLLQCSVTLSRNTGKHSSRRAEHVTGLTRRKCATRSARGTEKE